MVVHEEICSNCGMRKEAWKGNRGEGYTKENGERYCCEACAQGIECACRS